MHGESFKPPRGEGLVDTTNGDIPASQRASQIEYAIRDVVVPEIQLESQGHEISKLNIGDPIAYGLHASTHD